MCVCYCLVSEVSVSMKNFLVTKWKGKKFFFSFFFSFFLPSFVYVDEIKMRLKSVSSVSFFI